MGTCGIAAGAEKLLSLSSEDERNRNSGHQAHPFRLRRALQSGTDGHNRIPWIAPVKYCDLNEEKTQEIFDRTL